MRLTPNFTLEEFTLSNTAVRAGIDNTPPDAVLVNLTALAYQLESIRSLLDHPIYISSGYRCPRLNQLVGGSKSSAHVKGLAVDFVCPGFGTPLQVCRRIAMEYSIPIEQLIHEFGKWVHLAIAIPGQLPKRELLTIASSVKGYELGLNQVA